VRGAGTDANVFVHLFGDSGDSGERKLESSGNNFERGKLDIFGIEAVRLGELAKLRVRHDGSGFGSGWFLDNIVVEEEKEGKTWVFNCARWLDKGEDDGEIVRELVPTSGAALGAKVVKYKILVHTGDKRGAGTDANVFVILQGEKGDSGKRALESAGNNFERGKVDTFGIEVFDLGELKQITVGHDGSGFGSGWFLDYVIVRDETLRNKEYKFQCGRWLDKVCKTKWGEGRGRELT
jgi:lipoxygenase homology domain-containing protein 1